MNRKIILILFLGLLNSNNILSVCHDCRLRLQEIKAGRTRTFLIKTKCALKRFITRRHCCCSFCYKNNPNYRLQVVTTMKDRNAFGMMRCKDCGRHHICHICGRKMCLPDCNDHKECNLPKVFSNSKHNNSAHDNSAHNNSAHNNCVVEK